MIGDAWGRALLDHLDEVDGPQGMLEVEGGEAVPMLAPEWFFRTFDDWDPWDRELLPMVEQGPVLDLGAGAGRAALWFQERGFEVTAVEASPGAADVCRRRGVRDVRVEDLNEPPAGPWGAVLLLCGNLGLGGSWDGNRRLLRRLADRCAPGAVLVGDSVNDESGKDLGLRIRYGDLVTPWWRQRNVRSAEVPALVDGTGWAVERQVEAEFDHAVLLRRL